MWRSTRMKVVRQPLESSSIDVVANALATRRQELIGHLPDIDGRPLNINLNASRMLRATFRWMRR